jgi:hypothetical protein
VPFPQGRFILNLINSFLQYQKGEAMSSIFAEVSRVKTSTASGL